MNWQLKVEGREEEKDSMGQRKFFKVIDMFIILIVVMIPWVYTYIKTHRVVQFKHILVIVHQ